MITSTKALIARINRVLKREGSQLHISRSRYRNDLGDYYVTDFRNVIVVTHLDLESYARDLNVLQAGEVAA